MKKNLILAAILIVVLVVASYLAYVFRPQPAPDTLGTRYQSAAYDLSFTQPEGYYLVERQVGTLERPQLALVLVEDTQENRDVLNGIATTPREGPTAISIDVYPNTDKRSAEEWMRQDTNWTIRSSELTPITIAGIPGVSYTWSGLYEGRTSIVTSGTHAYVFSVTWMTREDRILTDFETLLQSVRFE